MSEDCLFCKIISKEIPAEIVFEDENVIGFKDISPQAKIHLLFVNKKHTRNINEIAKEDPSQLSDIFSAIAEYTSNNDLNQLGFRVVTNLGADAGQTVFHTHFHLLSGEKLGQFGSK